MTGRHTAPYDPARDSATPTRGKHRRPRHRGLRSQHDSAFNTRSCATCTYVGAHTPAGIAARLRRERRGYMNQAHEAARADLLGQAEALTAEVPTLQLVVGGA